MTTTTQNPVAATIAMTTRDDELRGIPSQSIRRNCVQAKQNYIHVACLRREISKKRSQNMR